MRKRTVVILSDGTQALRCCKCKRDVSVSLFKKRNGRANGFQAACNPCNYRYQSEWYKRRCLEQPVKHRVAAIKKRYGITGEQTSLLLILQGGVCGLCRGQFEGGRFVVDHCHATGRVRGLVHSRCNTMLGLSGDSVSTLQLAIEYLGKDIDGRTLK